MGLEKVIIKQSTKVAKNTIKLEDSLEAIENKLVNRGFELVETSGINPQLLPFDLTELINGEIDDVDAFLTPEFVCSIPPLTQQQKTNLDRGIERTKQEITNIVDNTNKIKQGLLTVQQPLQVLEVTAENLNNVVTTVKTAVKVIKSIPIPVAFGMPAISLPVNVLTILSDSLDQLDKFLAAGKGVASAVPPLVQANVSMIQSVIDKLNLIDSKVRPLLSLCSFLKSVSQLQPQCPLVEQDDINSIQSEISQEIQEALLEVGDTSIPSLNFLNETALIDQLQPGADPGIVYRGFRLTLEFDPENTYSFPARRIRGERYFSANLETAETLFFESGIDGTGGQALSGAIIVYNDPQELSRYSFSSSVTVLFEESKYAIDQYLLRLRGIPNKFNTTLQEATDLVQVLDRDQVDQFNQNNPLPDFILNGQNIVRPEVTNVTTGQLLGGPISVNGSIQINKPGVKIQMNSFGGTNTSNFVDTLLNITPPVGVGLPNQAAIISRNTYASAYNNAQEEYTFPATGSWGYLMRITAAEGGSGQTNFDLISP
jgi:translation elongation factor EF-1beta